MPNGKVFEIRHGNEVLKDLLIRNYYPNVLFEASISCSFCSKLFLCNKCNYLRPLFLFFFIILCTVVVSI